MSESPEKILNQIEKTAKILLEVHQKNNSNATNDNKNKK